MKDVHEDAVSLFGHSNTPMTDAYFGVSYPRVIDYLDGDKYRNSVYKKLNSHYMDELIKGKKLEDVLENGHVKSDVPSIHGSKGEKSFFPVSYNNRTFVVATDEFNMKNKSYGLDHNEKYFLPMTDLDGNELKFHQKKQLAYDENFIEACKEVIRG